MTASLSSRQQRVLAVGLFSLTIAAVWFGIIAPVLASIESAADSRASALRTLSRDRALVAQAPVIRTALTAVAQSPQWSRLYEGPKPDQAILQLETDLRAIVKAPNALLSMTAEPPVSQGPLTRVAVKVALTLPIDAWTDALSSLQRNPRLLRLETVVIQAPDFQAVDTNPPLSIQAEIVGYVLTVKATS